MSMKVFITGGAGFIGSHIVDSLVVNDHQVTVYDNFSSGHIDNLKHLGNKIKIVRGDILDLDKLTHSAQGHDIISHQAAQLEIMLAQNHPETDLASNTIGSLNVLQTASKNKIQHLIMASSACVYGQPIYLPQDENHPTNPNWSYGVSKLAMEKYAQIYAKTQNINITLLRYGIVYGPREWYRRALTLFIKRAINKQSPVIFGTGRQFRDLIYVQDIANFHSICLNQKTTSNQTYNLGSGKKYSIRQLANKVCKLSGYKFKPITEPVSEGECSRLIRGKTRNINDLSGMFLDITKAKKLGWKPQTNLADGISQSISWYKKNKSRWNKIAGA